MKFIVSRMPIVAFLLPFTLSAHHSAVGRYDTDAIVEIEGVVTDILWRNPHVFFTIEVTDNDGEQTLWSLESNSPNMLTRAGIDRDSIVVGMQIKAAGAPSLSAATEVFISNVLIPGRQELLLNARAEPRWPDDGDAVGNYASAFVEQGDSSRPELGLFRVWTRSAASPMLMNGVDYPLTDSALVAVQTFDPAVDSIDWLRSCSPKGMPTAMESPTPMEIARNGDDILLRIEDFDTERTIHMTEQDVSADESRSLFGYSMGRWDGADLLVTTTQVDWPWFNQFGIPQSDQSRMVERFSPSEDGSRLDYEMTVTDPVNFTEPVTVTRYWIYRPEVEVLPYNCAKRQ
jgi:Family of unknown function (DUF6152)